MLPMPKGDVMPSLWMLGAGVVMLLIVAYYVTATHEPAHDSVRLTPERLYLLHAAEVYNRRHDG